MRETILGGVWLGVLFLSTSGVLTAQYLTLDQDFEEEILDTAIWQGALDHFIIHEREDGNRLLRLNNEETSGGSGFHSQINTPSTVVYGEWEFSIEVPHTTTQNYVYIYLISDLNQSYTGDTVPEGEISGYAVYTGNKKFELRRIDNGSGVSLTSVPSEIVVGQLYHVRVTRSEDNEWQLQVRSAGDEQGAEMSDPVYDDTYTFSEYFGIYVQYTSGYSQTFYFDNFLIQATITDFYLEQVEVVSPTELDLYFSNVIDQQSITPAGFHLDGGAGVPLSARPVNQKQVRLAFAEPFSGGSYTLSINEIKDQFEQLLDPDTKAEFTVVNPFRALSAELITGRILAIEFTESPDVATWSTEAIKIINHNGSLAEVPDFEIIRPEEWPALDIYPESKEEHLSDKMLLLRLDSQLQDGEYRLSIDGRGESSAGWPLAEVALLDLESENPFYVTDVTAPNGRELVITFTLPVQAAQVEDIWIDGVGEPEAIQADPVELDRVHLQLSEPLEVGSHFITLNHIRSRSDWGIATDTGIEFTHFDTFEPGDLVISEFFYRTPVSWRTDEVDRPQYVEIYNRSGKLLNLRDFTINGEPIRTDADLPIESEGYLVAARGVSLFADWYDRVYDLRNFVEAERFPRLNLTTSSPLSIASGGGVIVDSLTYHPSEWGGNGVSLERYKDSAPAHYRENWAESEDALLGTPGLTNTVQAPVRPPEVVSIRFPSPLLMQVTFSGALSDDSATNPELYELDSEVRMDTIRRLEGDARTLEFRLGSRLSDQSDYRFTFREIEDIFGNRGSGDFEFVFENPFRIEMAEMDKPDELLLRLSLPAALASCESGTFVLSSENRRTGGDDLISVGTEGPSPADPADTGAEQRERGGEVSQSGLSEYRCIMDNSETVRLLFDSPLESGRYRITANGLESFVSGLSEQWLLETDTSVSFYQFDAYQPGDLAVSEFMYRPPAGSPKYVEIRNVSGRFLNLRDFELRRAEGASSGGGSVSGMDLPAEPGEYVVITESLEEMKASFGTGPWHEMSRFPGYTSSLPDEVRFLDPLGELIERIPYNPGAWGGDEVSLERRSVRAPAGHPANWAESESDTRGTPGEANSVPKELPGPELLSADFIDDKNIELLLSGAIDAGTVSAEHFRMSGNRTVRQLHFTSEGRVILTLDGAMTSGTVYRVTVRNLTDIFGNTLDQATVQFTYYQLQKASKGDIVINEFMYRPPEGYTRYIELYNRSEKTVDLAGWMQANDTGTRRVLTTEREMLPPGEFMVILPDSTLLSRFPEIPSLMAGSALSALKVNGDAIVIANAEGVVIDSLSYHPSWGSNGRALERRRAELSSEFAENWGESPAENLGTPGRANEINRDFELRVLRAEAIGRKKIEVEFNVPIRGSSVEPEHFQLAGSGGRPGSATLSEESVVALHFSDPLPSGHEVLEIRNLRSLGGFEIAAGYTVPVTIFDLYQEGDIVVNEFMYRPPETHPRFIELYNRSDRLLNLKGWRLQRRAGAGEADRMVSESDLVIEPESYLVLTDDTELFSQVYPDQNVTGMARYPAFTITTPDQIRLFTSDGILADSLMYNPSEWGGNGVALERLMTDLPSGLRENWAESPNPLLGTPGRPNEAVPDPAPPEIVEASQFEELGFRLMFSRKLNKESALTSENYQIQPEIKISLIGLNEEEVLLFTEEELVSGQEYRIRVSGVEDLYGQEMEAAEVGIRYLDFGTVEPGDLAINEVLYRRKGAGDPQFVEIYNRTEVNVDLSGWFLSDSAGSAVIPAGTAIHAEDYLLLTDHPGFAATSEKTVYLPDFQPLGVNGDAVVLREPDGMVADSLYYHADWETPDAGVSLERKDPAALTIDPANWAPSRDERGSTPGEINSRFEPDIYPPLIQFVNLPHPDSVYVLFDSYIFLNQNDHVKNKELGDSAVPTRFLLNGTEVEVIRYDALRADRVILRAEGIRAGEENILTVENLIDFQGNRSELLAQPVAQAPGERDLVINEIMFQPVAESHDGLPDQSEYIEIYNRKSYALSLEGLFLHDTPDEEGAIIKMEPRTTQARWIPAQGYALFYPEPARVEFTESRIARFFHLGEEFAPFALQMERSTLSLPNSGREVYLADSTGIVIDKVAYSDSWHNPNLMDTRGIALERINPDLESGDPSNWGSAAVLSGGTPGGENSLFQPHTISRPDAGITLSPNPFSPDGDGHEDHLMISYKLDEPDYLLKVRIYDRYGRVVRKLQDGQPAGLEGTLIWDGRNDGGTGNRIGIYIVVLEALNSASGSHLIFRQPVVIARQF